MAGLVWFGIVRHVDLGVGELRQVRHGKVRSGLSWPGAELVGSDKVGQGKVRQVRRVSLS